MELKINIKYNVEDEVYFLDADTMSIKKAVVKGIVIYSCYNFTPHYYLESEDKTLSKKANELFDSAEEVLHSIKMPE